MYHRKSQATRPLLPLVALAAALLAPAYAQTTAPGATAKTDDTVTMEKFSVSDVPVQQIIMPTARPFNSVYGTDDNIMDIPRNVTIVSREQMDAINIQDVTEFSKLTSSSYTDSNFGSPDNPSIRGQSADLLLNGMREHIGESGDGMPVDFNLVESVNIVPGPATAVQGASAYVGGFVDLISKQPFFDKTQGYVAYTYGSYNTNRWTFDVGGPLSPTLAYRFSYSGEDSDQYWYDSIKETSSVYGAITWRPSQNYELKFNAKAFIADYRENFGINRPTQLLIDQGLYQSGTNINNGTTATAADPQNAANINGSNTIAFGPLVKIDYRETAQGPASHAHGQEYIAQAIQTLTVSPVFKIVDNALYSYTKRDTYNSDGYSEIISPSWFVDNRTEFLFTLPKLTLNTGLEERYMAVYAIDDFFFEPVTVWDLSSRDKRTTLDFARSTNFGGFVHQPVPGWPGRYGTQGIINNDTNDSKEYNVSPYAQGTFKLSDQWLFVSGARLDMMHVHVRDPLTPNTSATTMVGEGNVNASLVYKVTPTISTYATANWSQNYTGDLGDGGGFGLYTDPNTGKPTLPRSLYAEQSKLFEYGAKTSLDSDKLFITGDLFYQTRQNKPQASPVVQYEYYGAEISSNYQPNKNFYATFGYSWINGSLPAPAPFQAYATQQIPNGPPDPFTNPQQSSGRLRAPGQPLSTLNALFNYKFDEGFGVEANVLFTTSMNNDYQGYLKIPPQYSIDTSLYYATKTWEIRGTINNLTNQHNWEPSVATYALEGIVSQPGIESTITFKYKF